VVIIIVFPEEIMSILFGSEFSNAAEPLRWLTLGTILITMNQPYSTQLLAANRSDLMAWMTVVSYFVMILMMIALVPSQIGKLHLLGLGLLGAALSYFSFALIYTILTRLSVNKISGTPFNVHMIVHLACAGVTGVSTSVLAIFVPISNILVLGMFLLFSMVLFYTLMFLLKEVRRSDIRYIMDMINPKKMFRYILDEIEEKK
jgi:O-antigen/teichoic acid export membrane protein